MSRTRENGIDEIDALNVDERRRKKKRVGGLVECLYMPHLYGILSRHADLKRLLRRSRRARRVELCRAESTSIELYTRPLYIPS